MRRKKKRFPFHLLLSVLNRSLALFGLYVLLSKYVATLPFVQRHIASLVFKGVHTNIAEWLGNWNLQWIIGG